MATVTTDFDTLMADDFRQELSNKVTAVGLFLADDILIPNNIVPGPGVMLPKLSFLTRLKNGDGKWKGRWEIFDANQASVIKSSNDFEIEITFAVFNCAILEIKILLRNFQRLRYCS